jgi:hypothetical protein
LETQQQDNRTDGEVVVAIQFHPNVPPSWPLYGLHSVS